MMTMYMIKVQIYLFIFKARILYVKCIFPHISHYNLWSDHILCGLYFAAKPITNNIYNFAY